MNDTLRLKLTDEDMRDLFALFAPEPTKEAIDFEGEKDRLLNPHGDSYKPQRRSYLEIRTQLRYQWADAMIQARTVTPR